MTERPDLNAFRTCPAATGQDETIGCGTFPDRAHRCAHQRQRHTIHQCVCRYSWRTSNTIIRPATPPCPDCHEPATAHHLCTLL